VQTKRQKGRQRELRTAAWTLCIFLMKIEGHASQENEASVCIWHCAVAFSVLVCQKKKL